MEKRKILIVDDDEVVLEILCRKVGEAGYEVRKLTYGSDVYKVAAKFAPDLILMDIVLPDIDGAEAVKELQKDPRLCHIPVIFLSGIIHKESGRQPEKVKVGIYEYPAIGKPVEVQEILKSIKEELG